MGPAVQEKRDAIQKQLLRKSLDKDTLKYLFIQTIILCNLLFSLVQNYIFYTWLKYVNSTVNKLFLGSNSTI